MPRGGARHNSGRKPKAQGTKGVTMTIVVTPQLLAEIDAAARSQGVSRSAAVSRLLMAALRPKA